MVPSNPEFSFGGLKADSGSSSADTLGERQTNHYVYLAYSKPAPAQEKTPKAGMNLQAETPRADELPSVPADNEDAPRSLIDFYAHKKSLLNIENNDFWSGLDKPWGQEYKPTIEAFKNLNLMNNMLQVGIEGSGHWIKAFDSDSHYKPDKRLFTSVYLTRMISYLKIHVDCFVQSYDDEMKQHRNLPPQDQLLYEEGKARAAELIPTVREISKLLKNPVSGDSNDPSFQKLAHLLTHLSDLRNKYSPNRGPHEDPLGRCEDKWSEAFGSYCHQLDLNKERALKCPETAKFDYELKALDRYRELGHAAGFVWNYGNNLTEKIPSGDAEQREWTTNKAKEAIAEVKAMAADPQLALDLNDNNLSDVHDVVARCQKYIADIMPSILRVEAALDNGGRGLSRALSKLNSQEYTAANYSYKNPFAYLEESIEQLRTQRFNALADQARKIRLPLDHAE